MLTVYGFGSAFGSPDMGPFVIKLETWLRMAKLPYRKEPGDLRKAPKQKIPYLADGNRLLADSSQIIEYLEEKHHDPLKEKQRNAQERALAQALKSMFEADLYFIVAYLRWWNDDDFEILRKPLAEKLAEGGVPKFAVPVVIQLARRSTRGQLDAQGTGRHAREEVYTMGRTLIDAAAESLGSKRFFLGNDPSKLDASAFGMFDCLGAGPFDNPVKSCLLGHQNLVDYCERIRTTYWAGPAASG